MEEIIDEEWINRKPNLAFTSKYEALVLASIIEKETANPSERTMISGVFSNRLSKRMRLQSDPTVIYGLGKLYAGNLKKAHLRQWTPHNTYKIKGLPPNADSYARQGFYPSGTSTKGDRCTIFCVKGKWFSHFFFIPKRSQ